MKVEGRNEIRGRDDSMGVVLSCGGEDKEDRSHILFDSHQRWDQH